MLRSKEYSKSVSIFHTIETEEGNGDNIIISFYLSTIPIKRIRYLKTDSSIVEKGYRVMAT